jgi:ribosomal protein S30
MAKKFARLGRAGTGALAQAGRVREDSPWLMNNSRKERCAPKKCYKRYERL